MTEQSIPATAEGMPNIQSKEKHWNDLTMMSDIRMQSTNLYFGTNHFTGHNLREMSACYDACRTLESVVAGLVSQPRFSDERTGRLNEAGETLHSIMEFIDSINVLITDTARSFSPVTIEDHETRAWMLLREQAFYAESLSEFNKLAAGLNADVGGEA
ncbi:hypothetical protein [Ochrobactrum sp. MYb379]|uniref:hypothetical protein n=1 Tax=Ochrobactrum sp. MYb379 TaxID=2745275 RepID=UPI0030A4351C